MVICLERGADLHTAQLMPLLITVCCFSEIQISFSFLVPAHAVSPGKRAVKRACARDSPSRVALCMIFTMLQYFVVILQILYIIITTAVTDIL